MGLLSWLIIGGLAGWIASMIMGNNREMGLVMNIVVGVLGGLLGGFVMNGLGSHNGGLTGFNLYSLLVAILGSVILLAIVNFFRRKS